MKSSLFLLPVAAALLVAACTVETAPADKPAGQAGQTGQALCPDTEGKTLEHTGEITGAETWKADVVHVVRGAVNVRDGGKLVVEPCAVVKLEKGATLNVAFPLTPNTGELVAEGTAERPIRFEGLDGARWGNIHVVYPGSARFSYVTIDGGGGPDTVFGESLLVSGDQSLPSKHNLLVDHVTVKNSAGPGVRITDSASFDKASNALTITGCGNDQRPFPLEISEYSIDTVPSGSYTGNKKDEILLDPQVVSGMGGLQEDATWHDRGVPYRVGETPKLDDFHLGQGNENVFQPTLTIEAGVTIKFLPGTGFFVVGMESGAAAIKALGTAEKPVVFTSASDDPKPGDWRGFYFNGPPSARNALDHVRIEYTGYDCSCSMVTCNKGIESYNAAIIFSRQPAGAFLTNSVIAHGSGHGVVQGYDGTAFDWVASNKLDDVAGCPSTLPRDANTHCPDPMPACQ